MDLVLSIHVGLMANSNLHLIAHSMRNKLPPVHGISPGHLRCCPIVSLPPVLRFLFHQPLQNWFIGLMLKITLLLIQVHIITDVK
jgi:hypothetical protein